MSRQRIQDIESAMQECQNTLKQTEGQKKSLLDIRHPLQENTDAWTKEITKITHTEVAAQSKLIESVQKNELSAHIGINETALDFAKRILGKLKEEQTSRKRSQPNGSAKPIAGQHTTKRRQQSRI